MITLICKVAADKPCTGDVFFPACLASLLWTNNGENDLRERGKGKHWVNLQGTAAADVLWHAADHPSAPLFWSSPRGAQTSFSLHA